MKAQRHTVTLSFVSPDSLPPLTGLAEIAYGVTTHLWPRLGSLEIRSRPCTKDEAKALDDAMVESEVQP